MNGLLTEEENENFEICNRYKNRNSDNNTNTRALTLSQNTEENNPTTEYSFATSLSIFPLRLTWQFIASEEENWAS